MRALVLVGIVACGPGLQAADTQEVGRHALSEASGDDAAIRRLLRDSVVNGGLWFADATCAAQFSVPGEIAADRLSAFASCIAGLHLQPSAREDALGDVVVMTYAPGFEVEARVIREGGGPRLTWIGFESRRNDADNAPTITPQALEALRLAGDRNGPLDPSIGKELALELDPSSDRQAAYTWIKLCVDETGTVTEAHPHETTSEKASRAFAAATGTWKFRPFTINGGGLPVCSMVRMAYPPDKAPPVETIPLPPPPSKGKREPIVFAEGTKLIEGKRIFGKKMIVPDDHTKVSIQKAKLTRLTGSFRICLDETGHPESVLPMRSTGFAGYDRDLLAGMRTWVYSPYLVDNEPVPVCTAITFIYRQR